MKRKVVGSIFMLSIMIIIIMVFIFTKPATSQQPGTWDTPVTGGKSAVPMVMLPTARPATHLRLGYGPGKLPLFDRGPVAASPSGRFLVMHSRTAVDGTGLFLCDLAAGNWYKLNDHAIEYDEQLAWLPNETGVVVSSYTRTSRWSTSFLHFSWNLYTLDGKCQSLTKRDNCVAWALIPDGSGIATLVYDENWPARERRMHEQFTVNYRVKIFELARRQWRDTGYVSPDTRAEAGGVLAFHRYHDHWVLSFPSHNQTTTWVNLSNGHAAIGEMFSSQFSYSPDGRYVLAITRFAPPTGKATGLTTAIYAANDWPATASANKPGAVRGVLIRQLPMSQRGDGLLIRVTCTGKKRMPARQHRPRFTMCKRSVPYTRAISISTCWIPIHLFLQAPARSSSSKEMVLQIRPITWSPLPGSGKSFVNLRPCG